MKISLTTATSLVIANMIGTGVFTSLGFQVLDITSGFTILLLWVMGGLVALCGALSYGEIGAAFPRSGSEYHYLSKIYHPALGFLSGFVSITVGFAAPVALAAMALGGYASKVMNWGDEKIIASAVILLLTLIHASSLKTGSLVQNLFTFLKVILITAIIIAGFFGNPAPGISFLPESDSFEQLLSPAFAIGLYWVSYSYSGWNAAAYIAGELDNPQKNLPKSLFRGTLVVTALYVFLNFIFLYTTPIAEMAGQKEVGYISAGYIFGEVGGKVIGGIIAILLVSSVSSMVLVGPRVAMVMGEDLGLLRIFSLKNKNGIPWLAVLFQSLISLVLIFTSTFESVLMYIGFTINIFTFLTVSGLFVLRIMKPELPRPYKTWGYPLPPIIFILVTGWILYKGFELKPEESTTGLLTVTAGIVIYLIDRIFTAQKK